MDSWTNRSIDKFVAVVDGAKETNFLSECINGKEK